MKSSRNPKGIPDDFSPYYEAARTLLAEGADLPRAERYLRKYLTQDPEGETPSPALAHWRLGLVPSEWKVESPKRLRRSRRHYV